MSSGLKVVGYCRTCGKALDESNVHSAQGAIFCEEHAPRPQQEWQKPEGPVPEPSPYTSPIPPPLPRSDVSPGLALALGFIPGVGAIYNGQYVKGFVHAIVFGLIISLLSSGESGFEPVLAIFLAAFSIYMPVEAYHTAKRRRAGQAVEEFSSMLPVRNGGSRVPVGPLILIVLGILFLLNNLNILELRRMARYWPAILILAGCYMLYTRMGGSASGGNRNR